MFQYKENLNQDRYKEKLKRKLIISGEEYFFQDLYKKSMIALFADGFAFLLFCCRKKFNLEGLACLFANTI
jgi:hypothetical protein